MHRRQTQPFTGNGVCRLCRDRPSSTRIAITRSRNPKGELVSPYIVSTTLSGTPWNASAQLSTDAAATIVRKRS